MASKPAPAGPEGTKEVDAMLVSLSHPLVGDLRELRSVFLAADPRILEGIKWNSVSFFYLDWFASFHLRSTDNLQVILHTGAKAKENEGFTIDDPSGLLKWLAKDRALMTVADVDGQKYAVTAIVRQWIEQMTP